MLSAITVNVESHNLADSRSISVLMSKEASQRPTRFENWVRDTSGYAYLGVLFKR